MRFKHNFQFESLFHVRQKKKKSKPSYNQSPFGVSFVFAFFATVGAKATESWSEEICQPSGHQNKCIKPLMENGKIELNWKSNGFARQCFEENDVESESLDM